MLMIDMDLREMTQLIMVLVTILLTMVKVEILVIASMPAMLSGATIATFVSFIRC